MRHLTVLLVVAALATACDGSGSPPGEARPAVCDREEIPLPAWLQGELPLPEGVRVLEDRGRSGPFFRATLEIPQPIERFGQFLRRRLPAAGYELGRGHATADRIEVDFSGRRAGGVLLASQPCADDETVVELLYSRNAEGLPPIDDRGSPFNP